MKEEVCSICKNTNGEHLPGCKHFVPDVNLIDWFDVNNKDHLTAYRHLQGTGCWPKGFLPENIEIPNGWHVLLMSRLSDAWQNHKLG